MTAGADDAPRLSKTVFEVRCLCEAVWKTVWITVENGVDNYVTLSSGGINAYLSAKKNKVFHRFMLKKNINFVNLHQNRDCG